MRRRFSPAGIVVAVALVATVSLLAIAAFDAPTAVFVQPALAAQPSPVVSVTTLPAVPSPLPSVHPATPIPAPSARPTSSPPAGVQPTQQPGIPAMPPGTAVVVGGLVANPMILTLKDLQRMPHTTLTLRIVDRDGRHRFHLFTGVLLRDIVDRARPNVTGGAAQSTAAYVVVQGLSGGPVIVGFPEFEHDYNAKQILVAFYQDTRPLDTPGIARLIVPEDNTQGRFITGITMITVGEPPR